MTDTYRSPAAWAPVNNKRKMAKGESTPVGPQPVSMAGGGRADSLMAFQAGMSIGSLIGGV